MKEIQMDCPQCGAHSGYLQPEDGDYTTPVGTIFLEVPWKCPQCGYPEVVWGRYWQTYTPNITVHITSKLVDKNGNEMCLCEENADEV